ncbi:uncharacterized protein L3040_008344 [Drepanopeziza brunnea f. sp. 'multigermtubi']|uniref:uncharacterized protein n=1 Tax=Drepanopeziza brunnea f. sp. 'multigermtubi' TaxID=698441 RepID=UPI00239BB647|nr:hypothetical protein L3040_008344 [Drepanopeziza brunnea f. sp. 'multigermtubi']
MARPTMTSQSPAPYRDDLYGVSPPPKNRRGRAPLGMKPPSRDSPSDRNKRKRGPQEPLADRSNTRRRTAEGAPAPGGSRRQISAYAEEHVEEDEEDDVEEEPVKERSDRRRQTVEQEDGASEDSCNYDPDQDILERRKIRKGMRDLDRKLHENRSEFLLPDSTGLRDTLIAANSLSKRVKQTSDATIDAKLLSTAADYTYKKTVALLSGNTAQGIDVDDLISKIKQFSRLGDDAAAALSSTQRARRDDGEDDEEMLNWAYLGRNACIMHNSRPSVPGFLLGPLSVEKRAKRVVARRAVLKHSSLQETRPEVLQVSDVQKDKNQNLSSLCREIKVALQQRCVSNQEAIENLHHAGMSVEQEQELFDRFDTAENSGLAYFKFVVNPWSFGQTVENMFYVSFLIRDGAAGISLDDRGLPYLVFYDDPDRDATAKGDHPKHQAVMSMDMAMWDDLIRTFDIKEPMIRHREEESYTNVGAKGWYA